MMKGMVFAERYKLLDYIGQGGMSLVYRAIDIRTGHNVAVKVLKSEYNHDVEFLERFQREAHAAGRMSHHNIVNLLDVGTEGEFRYLVLEYISGNTLKDIINEKGSINPNTAIQITIRILSALQHAHDNGIIHRDIKPQNVLVNTNGHIKVADFGIARITNTKTITKGDMVIGSVHYSSPEQARGNVVERTSDIYSTGIVLYEMLTGRVPFTGDNPVTIAMQQVNAMPPAIREINPDVPPAIASVVMKALEKQPKRRFQSAREMADALLKAKEGISVESTNTAPHKITGENKSNGSEAEKSIQVNSQMNTSRSQTQSIRIKRKPLQSMIAGILLGCIVVAGLVFGTISIYHSVINSATVPDIVGLTVEEAELAVSRVDLELELTEVYHDTISENTIIAQTPEADDSAKKGDIIVATVSIGPSTLEMPNLVGLTKDEAVAKLKDRGLSVIVFKTPSTQPVDTVIEQKPEKGETYVEGQEIELTLSGGSVIIPELEGLTLHDAIVLITENDLEISEIILQETETKTEVGSVLEQSPNSGSMAVLETMVTLTIGISPDTLNTLLSVDIPKSDEPASLVVTLNADGVETEEYSGETEAGLAYTDQVLLSVDEEGSYTCYIYLNGELLAEQEVEFR